MASMTFCCCVVVGGDGGGVSVAVVVVAIAVFTLVFSFTINIVTRDILALEQFILRRYYYMCAYAYVLTCMYVKNKSLLGCISIYMYDMLM